MTEFFILQKVCRFEEKNYICKINYKIMKSSKIIITKNQILKIEKARHRAELIDSGKYNIFKNQYFKDKTTYTRKSKHKVKF